MKQLIVLVATIILGITIGGIILGFGKTTTSLETTTTSSMSTMSEAISSAAGVAIKKIPTE